MQKVILIPSLCFSVILTLGAPASAAAQRINPAPPGETPYEEASVPCGTMDTAPADGMVDNPCGFNDVITFARVAITGWIMAGATIAALGFAYAGFLYITAMGSQEKISHALLMSTRMRR